MTQEQERIIERGRRLRDALADPDSDISWLQEQLNQRREMENAGVIRFRPGQFSLEYYLGRAHMAGLVAEVLNDAVVEGGRLFEQSLEQILAENATKRPQAVNTAPDRA